MIDNELPRKKQILPFTLILLGIISCFMALRAEALLKSLLDIFGLVALNSGIISIILEQSQSKLLQQSEKEIISNTIRSVESFKSVSLSGVDRIYENMNQALGDYASILERAVSRVDILIVPSVSFSWIRQFESTTLASLRQGVNFRVLLPDPNSSAFRFFSKKESDTFTNETLYAIEQWKELAGKAEQFEDKSGGNIHVHTYDQPPTLFMLIADDVLLFAPYLYMQHRGSSPCIRVGGRTDLVYQPYKQYFDKLWKESAEVREMVSR